MELQPTKSNEGTMGRNKLSIKDHAHHSHFTWEQRLQLQYYYAGTNGYEKIRSPLLLGRLLGKHESTVRRELKRGMVTHTLGDAPFERTEYNAEHAQLDATSKYSAKGPDLKLGSDWLLVGAVTRLIRDRKHSPYAVIAGFNNEGWPSGTRICEKTLYSYIQKGYMGDLTEKDLLLGGKRRKPKGGPRRHSRAAAAAKSISTRPREADERGEFGHWEADTVVGGTGASPACLLTLTERKTRFEIVRRMPDRTAEALN